MKKGLLIIAHGSNHCTANDDFEKLAANIEQRTLNYTVQHAFLDCGKPTISDGIDLLAKKEIREIVVLPYFLVDGKHTIKDIPFMINKKQNEYPDLHFHLKPAIGTSPEIANLILRLINE